MVKPLMAALAAASILHFAAGNAAAADDADLAQIREQIRQIRQDYEARLRSLEQRLQEAEARADRAVAAAARAPVSATQAPLVAPAASTALSGASAASGATSAPIVAAQASGSPSTPAAASGVVGGAGAAANAFNPAIALTLGGSYARLTEDPAQYRIQGFIPGGEETGPGTRNFNLGESELTLSANVDHRFFGQLTLALGSENEASVEEAFFRAQGLAGGTTLTGGRFLSGIGYLNSQHAHTWDFVDVPLTYRALFGGQYRNDGLQLKWLAPTERFLELGLEAGRGDPFPGNDRNNNGLNSAAAFVRLGDDWGESASWRLGLSYLRNRAADRPYDDVDSRGAAVVNAFSGKSDTWIADAVFKWAPQGNATRTNVKLQAEYFRRSERGTLAYDTLAQGPGPIDGNFDSTQSGFYVQGIWQFMPRWRVGVRFDKLYSGTPGYSPIDQGILVPDDLSRLLAYNPSRSTAMVDWSPSEFSRFRVQFAQDRSRPGVTDHQLFVQYIMNLGAHGAHAF